MEQAGRPTGTNKEEFFSTQRSFSCKTGIGSREAKSNKQEHKEHNQHSAADNNKSPKQDFTNQLNSNYK